MAIITLDGLVASFGAAQTIIISKASIATQVAGGYSSLWRGTGIPAQGAIPSTAAVCTNALTGCLPFTNPSSGNSYLGRGTLVCSNSATDIQVHDRLAHMGGLNGTTTGAQTVSVDVSGSGDNLANRRGAADYSELQWWLEIYTDIGTSAVSATVTYTRYPGGAGNTGQTCTVSIGGASPLNQDSRLFLITPTGTDEIMSVQTIQHATTGTAGSYGITASRPLTSVTLPLANNSIVADWAYLGLPRVHDSACLWPVEICGTTSTGTLNGNFKLVQG